jgi:hypothetical protein
MAEALTLSVPTEAEKNPQLDFLTGECATLMVLACTVWTPEADTRVRDQFNEQTQSSIDGLMKHSRYGQHGRMHDLISEETYRMRTAIDLPAGFNGYSLAAVDNGHTPGTSVPHVIFTNYVGASGVYVPGRVENFSGPYSGHHGPKEGLYTTPTAKEPLADMHTLGFSFKGGGRVYIGLKDALEASRKTNQLQPSETSHGSIILAPQADTYKRK